MKRGEKGQFFEKIGPSQTAARLKELGYNIEKQQIEMPEIEEPGEYDGKVKFAHNLEAQIKLIVLEEK